jgi:hypothetical protein
VLNESDLLTANTELIKEMSSIEYFVLNGVGLHINSSADEKNADDKVVRTAIASIQDMPLTQSSVAVLIAALHQVVLEDKRAAIRMHIEETMA